ncbi:hypothetical protein TWF106_003130 [Orbilia oligospora]|uniref:F-box domain-containing protein n=1 Tax=Orbilia oligospora TaxID=2813651 RepID=A0A6G1LX88_ORBOL|nr:hypothetical protein TWF679_001998 [Orbilia oligospora]KAF3200800.1 hypothetical protein TWF106_003130 [Orbilia oligospora]KAF3225933.1 hypothetical protein TWF191_004963 [Orbilia oligospora]KAF3237249.1 hypothetical protein TWF192_010950 [Orbilia oligospora]
MDTIKSPLDLPLELFEEVMSYISGGDLQNFARSSKPAYRITFQGRFRGVTIDSKNLILFRDTDIFRQIMPWIASVRFAKPWCAKHIGGAHEKAHDISATLAEFTGGLTIPNIQSKLNILQYFPALTHLSFSYYIPSPLQRSIFLMMLKHISTYPFFQNLKRLEVIVSHIGTRWCPGDSFESIIAHQAVETREILGPQATENDVEKFIEDMGTEGNLLVSLEYAKISIHEVSNPHRMDDSYSLDNTQFYFRLLTLAPNLEELEIESTKRCEYGCNHYVRLQTPIFTTPAPWFHSVKLKELSILKDTPFTPLEISTLAGIFPNIEALKLDYDYKTPRCQPELDFENFHGPFMAFKKINRVYLPRPDSRVCRKRLGFELRGHIEYFLNGLNNLNTKDSSLGCRSRVCSRERCVSDLEGVGAGGQGGPRDKIDFFFA